MLNTLICQINIGRTCGLSHIWDSLSKLLFILSSKPFLQTYNKFCLKSEINKVNGKITAQNLCHRKICLEQQDFKNETVNLKSPFVPVVHWNPGWPD